MRSHFLQTTEFSENLSFYARIFVLTCHSLKFQASQLLKPMCVLSHFNRVQLFATLQTTACQAPLSMELSRSEYWSGPFPSPGDLPNPGIKPRSPTLKVDSLPSELPGKSIKIHILRLTKPNTSSREIAGSAHTLFTLDFISPFTSLGIS